MGTSVSGAGDVNGDGYADVIVGAYMYDSGQSNEGAFYVYHGSASGIDTLNPAMVESNHIAAYMGRSVSGAGDVNGDGYADVIVGAYGYDNGQTDEGAAFVYHGSATGISTTHAAMVESNQGSASMGYSVSGAGDVNGDGYADVIVGAPYYDIIQTDGGAAFIYHGGPSGISTTYADMVELDQTDAYMGYSVSGAGDVNGDGYADVIVGAYRYDNGQTYEGAAFVYHGGATGISTTHAAMVESDQGGARMGYSVSGAGDVNGDGYADVIVGAYLYDSGESIEGAAFVYHGSATGISTTYAAMVESNQANARMGRSVSGAGDVNGDGYADVIVGAHNYSNGQTGEGAAFVYHGSPTGISTTHAAMVESDQAGALMGNSVSGAGDVNGDGYADVIVGAYLLHWQYSDEGAAFVYHGSATGISTTYAVRVRSGQANAYMGSSVSGAGDVNGDGYADVIVGASGYDSTFADEGAAFVYHGSALGISTTYAAMVRSNQYIAFMGSSVSGAGDVNGDGYSDVIVGAYGYSNVESGEGAAFVYHGSATGISTTYAAKIVLGQTGSQLGSSVSGAGDVNGDGYADVIVGANYYDNGETDEGAAFVYHGSYTGISNIPAAAAMVESNQAGAEMGYSVSGAGDVNGDGYADVIVGAYGYSNVESGEGAAFVYHGNSDGRPVLAMQMRGGGDATLVQPWGMAYDPDDFQVSMRATDPTGRGRVKLQVEYCPSGAPFGDVSCGMHISGTWTDVTATPGGVTLTETISGLSVWERYRWRSRVLYAPYTVYKTGITAPPKPSHGPWRSMDMATGQGEIFMSDTTPPSTPGTPADAGAYIATTSITFNWTGSSDPETGISGYNLQVGTTAGGSDVYDGFVGNVLTYEITGSDGQTLYARVQAVNGIGLTSSWSGNSDGITIDMTLPVLSAIGTQSATEGSLFGYTASATDSTPITYSLTANTTGMTVNGTSGLIQWTPAYAQVGAHAVTVRATDAAGNFTETSFDVNVSYIDTDADGLPDTWENTYYIDLSTVLSDDTDNDGLTALAEFMADTDPTVDNFTLADTDSDGLPDAYESANGLDPNSAADVLGDPDADGYANWVEYLYGLDPQTDNSGDADTDGDGIIDSIEEVVGTTVGTADDTADPDVDGYTNAEEIQLGTLPLVGSDSMRDGDADGIPDTAEVLLGLAFTSADSDGDGIGDAIEVGNPASPTDSDGDGTIDALDTDSDNDSLTDAQELSIGTSRTNADSDGDGIGDTIEVGNPASPTDSDGDGTIDALDTDSDNDSLTDAQELSIGTSRTSADSDGDGIGDATEVGDPASPTDTDGDGIIDTLDTDSDNDGFTDASEAALGSNPVDEASVPVAISISDGGSVEGITRVDGGADSNNLDTLTGNPRADVQFTFSLVVTATASPQNVRLYMAQRQSPEGYFYAYDMTCTGDFAAGATCSYITGLGPAAVHSYYFEVVMSDGTTVIYPSSGHITGPTIEMLNDFAMVGVPRDLTGTTLDGPAAFSSTDVYRWDPVNAGFTLVDSSSPAMSGEGYFAFRQAATLPENAVLSEIQETEFVYELKPGWNMISNPYSGNVKFQDVMFKRDSEAPVTWLDAVINGWVVNALYFYKGSDWGGTYGYEMGTETRLTPWIGYWLYLNMDDGVYYLIVPKP
jgi:hypothetical protein